ncbi:MAG: hypothetical protein ACI9MC_004054 [Kiritimatiellia bacterium]|jgi:hypothetical protein
MSKPQRHTVAPSMGRHHRRYGRLGWWFKHNSSCDCPGDRAEYQSAQQDLEELADIYLMLRSLNSPLASASVNAIATVGPSAPAAANSNTTSNMPPG